MPYAWLSVACDVVAFLLLLIPATRKNPITLNLGCLLIYAGTYIEKGIGLLIPGFTPDALGQINEYTPSMSELQIAAGIFSVGFLLYTVMVKVAVPVMLGEFKHANPKAPVPGACSCHGWAPYEGLIAMRTPASILGLICLSAFAAAAWSQTSTAPTRPAAKAPRPTTDVPLSGCVTPACHANIKSSRVLHGPVNVNACDACHRLTSAKEHTFAPARRATSRSAPSATNWTWGTPW